MSNEPVKFAFYEPETTGVYKSNRKLRGYVWEEKNGSVIVERSDGKKVILTLP